MLTMCRWPGPDLRRERGSEAAEDGEKQEEEEEEEEAP